MRFLRFQTFRTHFDWTEMRFLSQTNTLLSTFPRLCHFAGRGGLIVPVFLVEVANKRDVDDFPPTVRERGFYFRH